MNNKTSDINVAIIEELIQEYKTYNDLDGIQDLSIYVNALENILADYTRQKQINEEHQKLNGELREKVKELEEKNKHLPNVSDYETISLECIHLGEQLEVANDRIQELETVNRENKKKYLVLLIGQFPDTTETYKKYYKELQELLEGEK